MWHRDGNCVHSSTGDTAEGAATEPWPFNDWFGDTRFLAATATVSGTTASGGLSATVGVATRGGIAASGLVELALVGSQVLFDGMY